MHDHPDRMDGLASPVPVLVRGGRVEGDGVTRPELVQLETHVGLQVPADDDAVLVPVVPDRARKSVSSSIAAWSKYPCGRIGQTSCSRRRKRPKSRRYSPSRLKASYSG